MRRRGYCGDSAAVESYFSRLKLGGRFINHGVAKHRVLDYIEVFYDRQRRHSSLGYVSPAEYEALMSTEAKAA